MLSLKEKLKEFDENFPPPKLEGYTTGDEAIILEKEKVVHEAKKQFFSSYIQEILEGIVPEERKWQKSDSEGFSAGEEVGMVDGWNDCRRELQNKIKEILS